MRPADRRSKILELVQQSARVTVDELAEGLDISRETVRRDLVLLSEQGALAQIPRRGDDGARYPVGA
jgi:DeoR/GlpR family transcriptional regulator of sugar metabolism